MTFFHPFRRGKGQSKKYGNRKIVTQWGTFDSDVEYQYFLVLQQQEKDGKIFNLTIKPSFPLVVERVKITERPFRPDFAYFTKRQPWIEPGPIEKLGELFEELFVDSWRNDLIVCDCKGYLDPGDAATRIFEMKRKLMLALYRIDVKIIQTPQAERQQARRRTKRNTEAALLRKAMKA